MIKTEDLKESDIGRWVIYTDGTGKKKSGRIKLWTKKYIFVVYHCNGQWDRFKDFTGVATSPKDLQFKDKKIT